MATTPHDAPPAGGQTVFQEDTDEIAGRMAQARRADAGRLRRVRARARVASVSRFQTTSLLVGILVSVAVFVASRAHATRHTFDREFEWFEGERGYRRGERARGHVHFSMWCLGIAVLYPNMYRLLTLTFTCRSIEVVPATFLMIMVREFASDLRAIHWAGSAEQLRRADLAHFVSGYAAWDSPLNAFRFLLPSAEAFESSFAVHEARRQLDTSMLGALYQGGLCHLALSHYSGRQSALDMARALLGRAVVHERSCDEEAASLAFESGLGSGALALTTMTTATTAAASVSTLAGAGSALGAGAGKFAAAAAGPKGWAAMALVTVAVGAYAGYATYNDVAEHCQGRAYYTLVRDEETGQLRERWGREPL